MCYRKHENLKAAQCASLITGKTIYQIIIPQTEKFLIETKLKNFAAIDIEFVMPSVESLGMVTRIIFHTFHTANIFHKNCVKLVPIDPL
jgi:hypothetical protein